MRAEQKFAGLSRRVLIGSGAATALLGQPLMAQTIAAPPPGMSADETARIAAATDSAEHMTIPVMINGRGPFRFVVDTGADRSVLAEDVAVALGLVRGNEVTVQGVVRSLGTRVVPVAMMSFGTVVRQNLSLPLLPRAYMEADGYLGLDAIDGLRVTLDFESRALMISRGRVSSAYFMTRPTEAHVPLRGEMGHLRATNCRVDGVGAACFIDTGAEISVGNMRLFEAISQANPRYASLGDLPITGITGGAIMAKVMRIGNIKLHSVSFTDAGIGFADMQIFDVWGLSRTPALLIGMNFLRQFARVQIDYSLKEIRFDLASLRVAQRA